ncbi:hypothetical protein NJ76_20205 [Rhodococcus sp. IITR03]|nr:hypothetical protein NJ76_20205 [Rhodococcus sp. IITR03]
MSTHENELLNAVLGTDPGLTRPIPSSAVLADFVMPHILKIRDDGNGNLRQLPSSARRHGRTQATG